MMHIDLRNDDNYFGVPLPDGNDFHVHSQWESDEEVIVTSGRAWGSSAKSWSPRSRR